MPTNGWTRNVELLLKNWSKQISINEYEYQKRGTYYKRWYLAFGIIIIVSQAVTVTALINIIISIAVQDDSTVDIINKTILGIVAFADIGIIILQGIDKFMNFGSTSEKYHEASKNHNALSRLIDTTLSLPRHDRDVAREVLLSVRQQFDYIQSDSPNLPANSVVHKLDMCIYENPTLAKGSKNHSPESTPEINEIQLPKSVPQNKLTLDEDDEERISNCTHLRIEKMLHQNKVKSNKEGSGILDNLDYQWERMEHHAEEAEIKSDTNEEF